MKALLEIFFKWLWPDFWSCHCCSVPSVIIIMYTEWDQWKTHCRRETERGSNGPGGEAATEANNVVLTHWWGRDWGLHQASSDWDHETTMAPLGRPALPTRPYPNICGTAQFSILLGSLCYLFGLLYQLSWLLGPNKWQNFGYLLLCFWAFFNPLRHSQPI